MSMSSSSASSTSGTSSRPPSAISAVSLVRGKRVCTQASRGSCATCSPSRRDSSRPRSVRATGTAGSPFTRRSMFSVDSPWRARTKTLNG